MQNKHFKTDNTEKSNDGFGEKISNDKSNDRSKDKKKERERKREAAVFDEDDDLKRAIELSKKTAQREEKERAKDGVNEKNSDQVDADKDGEFDFGAGFEKFATNQNDAAGNNNPNDLDGFDFGDVAGNEEIKDDKDAAEGEDFDFNFGGDQPEKKAEPNKEGAPQTGDLLDLLGGLDMNAGSTPPPSNPSEKKNALDFFNNDDAGGALGNAAAQNAQKPQAQGGDVFDFNNAISQPAQQQQPAEPEKPKGFLPNPGLAMSADGGFAMPQQQQQQQQQYGTAMPGNFSGQNPFGQQQNYPQQQQFQTSYQGGYQQQQNFNQGYDQNQQYNQGYDNQGYQQQDGGFAQQQNFGTGYDQNSQAQQPYGQQQSQQQAPQQQQSTPFDMFN